MCATFDFSVCETRDFQEALKKENNCLPGERSCEGYQFIFGGIKRIECKPWDLDCTLYDQFGTPEFQPELAKYPLIKGMPKTTLTI